MEQFIIHTGPVTPLNRENVDTNVIIPKQSLKSTKHTDPGSNLSNKWRYRNVGEPGQDGSKRSLSPGSMLNQPRYKGVSMLLVRKNFGCDSPREHTPQALQQYGFRAVTASSFTDVFLNNCFKNGLLPIMLTESQVDHLLNETQAFMGYQLTVDPDKQVVIASGGTVYLFDITTSRKYCLLGGFNDISLASCCAGQIKACEVQRPARMPQLVYKLVN